MRVFRGKSSSTLATGQPNGARTATHQISVHEVEIRKNPKRRMNTEEKLRIRRRYNYANLWER